MTRQRRRRKTIANPEPLNDLGNARRFVTEHGRDLRYIEGLGWLRWDSRRWSLDDRDKVYELAKQTACSIYGEAASAKTLEEAKTQATWARQSGDVRRLRGMVDLARSEPRIRLVPDDLDREANLLNCQNGMLDLRTGKLHPHLREDLITKLIPIDYDPKAEFKAWDDFLSRAQPDEARRRYLQTVVGYTALGNPCEDCWLSIYGPTRTGKGTFQGAIQAALGDYAASASPTAFAQLKYDTGVRPELVKIRGARLVTVYETSDELRLSASLLKSIAGGDPVTVRRLYANPVTFTPRFTVLLASNYRPRLNHADDAVWQRVRELPFTEQLGDGDRDPNVRKQLRDPSIAGPAVLAWIAEGARLYLKEGLEVPDSVRSATAKYREEMDPLHDFIEARCEMGPEEADSWARIYQDYADWCRNRNPRDMLGERRFRDELRARGCVPKKVDGARGWRGIRVRTSGMSGKIDGKRTRTVRREDWRDRKPPRRAS